MKIGSLFSGYGGLDCGVQLALGGTVAWHCDNDPGVSKILAHHWPDTPNLGDITAVDWTTVEPVDVITGGFPCQDVSHAGKRLGLRPGTRTGLWSHMAYAIGALRPALVIAENVRGLLSARADGDLEPCPWCLGDERDDALRALGAVLGDLAELGYDARWCGVRAADVGAPHGRFRVFVVAADAQPGRTRAGQWRSGSGQTALNRPAPDATRDGRDEGWTEPARIIRGRDAPERGHGAAADAGRERHGRGEDTRSLGRLDDRDAGTPRQRERAREVAGDRGAEAAADATQPERGGTQPEHLGQAAGPAAELGERPCVAPDTASGRRARTGVALPESEHDRPEPAQLGSGSLVAWGVYGPAIRRWEHLTRPAPAPTEPGNKGQPRLSPRFVEWLMGLPAGHVTAVPGLSRNDQLRALGNGCVPQQAAAAIRLLDHLARERAA